MRTLTAVGTALLTSVILTASATAAPNTPKCTDAELSHQFDFWIGEWDVTSGGTVAGTNRIERILDGCVLQETWSGAKGSAGSSLNFYDPQKKKWRQLWVWRQGTTLETEGEFRDGKMTLQGRSVTRKGDEVINRITWNLNDDGTVRQHWEVSKDDGKTWSTSFDGLYTKKK